MIVDVAIGDITTVDTDAIVNAANETLRGGGGVDGAIHRAAGLKMIEELIREYPEGMATGDAVITYGYDLPAMYVIHTAGPRYKVLGQDHPALLASCYQRCLEEADRLGLTSIAFPAISTGIYEYPKDEAAAISLRTILNFEAQSLKEVLLVFLDEEDAAETRKLLAK